MSKRVQLKRVHALAEAGQILRTLGYNTVHGLNIDSPPKGEESHADVRTYSLSFSFSFSESLFILLLWTILCYSLVLFFFPPPSACYPLETFGPTGKAAARK